MLEEAIKSVSVKRVSLRLLVGFLVALLLPLRGAVVRGQEIGVEAPESVYVGQQFQVTFVLSGKPKEFKEPDWGKIQMQYGPAVGHSSQISVVNGKMSRSTSYTYSYVCKAVEAGDLTVGAARAEMESGRQTSAPFTIRVLSTSGGAGMSSGGDEGGAVGSGAGEASSGDAFIALELSRNETYVGQPVVATVKVYTRLDLVGFDDIRFPSFNGFWVKEISTPQQISFSRAVVKGKEYNVGVLRSYLLYPQKAGEQKLEGLEAVVQYRERQRARSFFDEFMGSFSTATMSLRGAGKQLVVRALPESGRPSGFSGAVGRFSATSKIDKEELEANDALTYTLTLEGVGNLHALTAPEITFPSTVEAYAPVVKENYSVKGDNQAGSITYEYVLIPRAPGEVEIPEYNFAYFNPTSGKYEESRVRGYKLRVSPGQGGGGPAVVGRGGDKEDVQVLGNDIRHIHSTRGRLYSRGERFVGGMWFLLWMACVVLATLVVWLFLLRKHRMESDRELLRDRRAGKLAQKRLRRAKGLMGSGDEVFYAELLRALWGFLGDKLHLEQHELSSESVGESLRRRGVPEEQVDKVRSALVECEYAQYGMRAGEAKEHSASYARALEVISGLDAWLKRGGGKAKKEE